MIDDTVCNINNIFFSIPKTIDQQICSFHVSFQPMKQTWVLLFHCNVLILGEAKMKRGGHWNICSRLMLDFIFEMLEHKE